MCNSGLIVLGKLKGELCISRPFCTLFLSLFYGRGITSSSTQTNQIFIRPFLPREFIFPTQLNPFYAHYPQPLLSITTNLFNS